MQATSPLVPPLYEARVNDWIRHGLERKLGLSHPTIEELDEAARNKRCSSFLAHRQTIWPEAGWDQRFDDLRMSRLRMGHLRYGVYGRNQYDAIGSCLQRLDEYVLTGNQEHLVDIVNLIEIEWIHPNLEVAGAFRDFNASKQQMFGYGEYARMERALGYYQTYGERRYLVITANIAEHEFLYPRHKSAHFAAQDNGGHWSLRNGAQP
jgi:hypothetical protein